MSKNAKIKIIVGFFILLMIILIYVKFERDHNEENQLSKKIDYIFRQVEPSTRAKIDKYIVYGTHFNIEGKVEIPKISGISIYSSNIILKNINGEDLTLHAKYEYKDGILSFSTLDKINEGLSLEDISTGNYYLFLKVIFSNSEEKYYSFENNSKYGNLTYYTLTKKEKIDISFNEHKKITYMQISALDIENLPDGVYDIVIDASHGGSDSGAKTKEYTEADLVLKCAKLLKKNLEEKGYKVFLTRDGSESKNANMATNMYDEKGRINTAQESHSKILISLNINDVKSKTGGIEVYAPCLCNLDFAKLLANNIVKTAKTSYSSVKSFKQENGVYVRNCTNVDILGLKSNAILKKYEPYSVTNNTPYLYMIREVGGIATNAYVDGRNTSFGKNKYFDSNVGIESYSIELGYMNVEKDLNNIVKNSELYAKAISDSISEFYTKK